jgi:hypothetical protein
MRTFVPNQIKRTMNTYRKFCTNVFVAQCAEPHQRGETILVTTKHGKENECIVHNFVAKTADHYFYSITRADGFSAQERMKKKAERFEAAAANSEKKSDQYWRASEDGKDFLSLGEPIKIGHHSEKRHRALIERNHNRIGNAIAAEKKAEEQKDRAAYYASRTEVINLSMPESVEYFEFKLEEAKAYHEGLKNGTIEREHSFSMQYANKAVKDMEKNLGLAKRLWGN